MGDQLTTTSWRDRDTTLNLVSLEPTIEQLRAGVNFVFMPTVNGQGFLTCRPEFIFDNSNPDHLLKVNIPYNDNPTVTLELNNFHPFSKVTRLSYTNILTGYIDLEAFSLLGWQE